MSEPQRNEGAPGRHGRPAHWIRNRLGDARRLVEKDNAQSTQRNSKKRVGDRQ